MFTARYVLSLYKIDYVSSLKGLIYTDMCNYGKYV